MRGIIESALGTPRLHQGIAAYYTVMPGAQLTQHSSVHSHGL